MSGRVLILARLVLAAASGFAAGAATEWSVPHLPFSLEPLGNTAAPWVIFAFVTALTARGMGESLVLAVVTLITLVLGFYADEAHRGWPVSKHQIAFWTIAGVIVGPLVGLAAGSLRHAGRLAGAVGGGVLGGLLVGESMHGIRELRFSTPTRYWHVQLVVGVALTVALAVWRGRRRLVPALGAALATCGVVALGTMAVYQAF